MATEKVVSPGVFTNEIDKSFLPAAIADIGAAIIGPTVKGPAGIPTIVTSYAEFQERFGDTFTSGSNYYTYLTSLAAKNYLKNSDKLTVVRILAGDFSTASATVSSSLDPVIVGTGLGTFATGSISFFNGTDGVVEGGVTSSYGGTSASFVENGRTVKFVFTGSAAGAAPQASSTHIYVNTGSSTHTVGTGTFPDIAASWVEHINNSSSIHGLNISASKQALNIVGITSSLKVNYQGGNLHGGPKFNDLTIITGSKFQTGSFTGTQSGTGDSITSTLRLGGGSAGTFEELFKIHTLTHGLTMNSTGSGNVSGENGILTNGSKDNIRWEISSVNTAKGTFTLVIRRGNDIHKRKQVLETWPNLTLDPEDKINYIAKVIGDSYHTIEGSGGSGNVYLKPVGTYPNKSKYVRVEVLKQTVDYMDVNGNVRVGALSASLPHASGSGFSGSYGGSFDGGSDGTVNHPIGDSLYENISEDNSQGLDISNDGGNSGYNQYVDALDLLSNQDEYDLNLILMPGAIGSIHSSITTKAIDVCESRGDCFVVLDPVPHGSSIVAATDEANTRDTSYAATYWPWVQVTDQQLGKTVWVPPSVGVISAISFNDRVSHEWFAPAGLNRGTLDTVIQAERKLTITNRDDLYSAGVNPIATFPREGVTVYGQKTLQKKSSALDRVNVRRLLIKVKKFIASSSRFLVFEQNTAATRRRFLNIAQPFLEQIQSQSGLNAFRVVMNETNNTADVVDRNILYGQIFVQPTRTAEFIVLDFTVQPSGATFEG